MITVSPATFTKVEFDHGRLEALAAEALERIAELPGDLDVEIQVDQDQATSRLAVASLEPVVLAVESGAIEDRKHPRTCGEVEAAIVFTRLLLEVVDRRSERFGAPDIEAETSLAHNLAWDVNLCGRTARLDLPVPQPRFRYHFRHRHGFSGNADRIFDQLWAADQLTWRRITELSDRATDTVVTGPRTPGSSSVSTLPTITDAP